MIPVFGLFYLILLDSLLRNSPVFPGEPIQAKLHQVRVLSQGPFTLSVRLSLVCLISEPMFWLKNSLEGRGHLYAR